MIKALEEKMRSVKTSAIEIYQKNGIELDTIQQNGFP